MGRSSPQPRRSTSEGGNNFTLVDGSSFHLVGQRAVCRPARPPSSGVADPNYSTKTSFIFTDAAGNTYSLDTYFDQTGTNTWEVDVYNAADATSASGFPYSTGPLATQALTFSNGAVQGSADVSVALPDGQSFDLDFAQMTVQTEDLPKVDITNTSSANPGLYDYATFDGYLPSTASIVPAGSLPASNSQDVAGEYVSASVQFLDITGPGDVLYGNSYYVVFDRLSDRTWQADVFYSAAFNDYPLGWSYSVFPLPGADPALEVLARRKR